MKMEQTISLYAGGPGSGRKPGYGKGLKQVKPFSESTPKEKANVRSNPNQKSLFGPGHTNELQKIYKTGNAKLPKEQDPMYKPWGGIFEKKINADKESIGENYRKDYKWKITDKGEIKAPAVHAGLEDVEMEGKPVSRAVGGTIQKVGTQFCVVKEGVDKNFGCYPSREQAEAVRSGKSFIDIESRRGTTTAHVKSPKTKMGVGHKLTNPSMPSGVGVAHRTPNPSMRAKKISKVKSYADMGEPMAGALQHAHLDTNLWFRPPSLKNGKRIPTDDPKETDDRFLDVTKRKQAHKDRMKILKRSAPGGLPPSIPAHTTLLSPHQASYVPGMFSAGGKTIVKTRPAREGIRRAGFRAFGAAKI